MRVETGFYASLECSVGGKISGDEYQAQDEIKTGFSGSY